MNRTLGCRRRTDVVTVHGFRSMRSSRQCREQPKTLARRDDPMGSTHTHTLKDIHKAVKLISPQDQLLFMAVAWQVITLRESHVMDFLSTLHGRFVDAFNAMTLLLGDRKGIQCVQTQCWHAGDGQSINQSINRFIEKW